MKQGLNIDKIQSLDTKHDIICLYISMFDISVVYLNESPQCFLRNQRTEKL